MTATRASSVLLLLLLALVSLASSEEPACLHVSDEAKAASGPAPLNIPGTIIVGRDYLGKGYCLVSQMLALQVGNGGVWLTPCEYCLHANGSGIHFRTVSRFFKQQHEFDVAGDFTAPEGNGRILVLRSAEAFLKYVEDDVKMTALLNEALDAGMTPFARAMFGTGIPFNVDSLPGLRADVTYMTYMMSYGMHFATGNWPAQFMLMLQALTTCTSNPMEPFCPQLAQAFTPQLLQLKSNEKNEDSQCSYLPCPAGAVPAPRSNTAWINDQETCLAH